MQRGLKWLDGWKSYMLPFPQTFFFCSHTVTLPARVHPRLQPPCCPLLAYLGSISSSATIGVGSIQRPLQIFLSFYSFFHRFCFIPSFKILFCTKRNISSQGLLPHPGKFRDLNLCAPFKAVFFCVCVCIK